MYHRVRRKMRIVVCAILIVVPNTLALPTIATAGPETKTTEPIDNYENNVIDFDDEYSVKFSNRYGVVPWNPGSEKYVKDSHKYTIIKDDVKVKTHDVENSTKTTNTSLDLNEPTTETDYSVIPLELVSTTENYLISIIESTTDNDLSVIPLSTTTKDSPNIEINQTVTLPTSTQESETTTDVSNIETTTEGSNVTTIIVQTTISSVSISNKTVEKVKSVDKTEVNITTENVNSTLEKGTVKTIINSTTEKVNKILETTTENSNIESKNDTTKLKDEEKTTPIINTTTNSNITEDKSKIPELKIEITTVINNNTETATSKAINYTENINVSNKTIKPNVATNVNSSTATGTNGTTIEEILKTNSSTLNENVTAINIDSIEVDEKEVPVFTELDAEDEEVPEDYYDSKDVVPTTAPNTNALSVLVGLAGSVVESVVESVAERVVPKGIYDLFKRMQKQSADLEAERLRSREENGGLGQFGRGILKTISSGLSKPLSQLMAGAKDIGSLDTDRGFVGSLASGVTSVATVATSLADAFKDRVQAIYPGTVWCGDGHSATARSGELGLFFFTDTCCRQHDACKIYIKAGETKYGLTNTGLFTRSDVEYYKSAAKSRKVLNKEDFGSEDETINKPPSQRSRNLTKKQLYESDEENSNKKSATRDPRPRKVIKKSVYESDDEESNLPTNKTVKKPAPKRGRPAGWKLDFDDEAEEIKASRTRKPVNPLQSVLTRRVADGCLRRTASLPGDLFVELRLYNSSDIKCVEPKDRWQHSVLSLKYQTDSEADELELLRQFIKRARRDFVEEGTFFADKKK